MHTGVLEKIYVNQRQNRQNGNTFNTYRLVINGEKYDGGTKAPPCTEGTPVGFEFSETQYGKKITSLIPQAGVPMGSVMSPSPQASPPAVDNPVKLSRERCIVRQNALTNAVNYMKDAAAAPLEVIGVASVFEAYTSGDMDQEEVQQARAALFPDVEDDA